MAKTLPTLTRPGRAQRRPPQSIPTLNPRTMQIARVMRTIVIGFCILILSIVWLSPNSMGWVAQLVVTAWLGLIGGLGLLVLHRAQRQSLRQLRLASGSCVECGYDLRNSPDRCPECGAVRAAG